jgi:hypothetical protein
MGREGETEKERERERFCEVFTRTFVSYRTFALATLGPVHWCMCSCVNCTLHAYIVHSQVLFNSKLVCYIVVLFDLCHIHVHVYVSRVDTLFNAILI